MTEHSYLIFNLNDNLYGVDSLLVEEIFFLPELTTIPDSSREIIGVVNLRGNIVPVIDLNLCFGYQSNLYKLTDSVMVLNLNKLKLGIIVEEVKEVRNIPSEQITNDLSLLGLDSREKKKFVQAIAKSREDILILLNPDNLFNYSELSGGKSTEKYLELETQNQLNYPDLILDKNPTFCPHITPEERAIFRQRGESLRESIYTEELKGLKPLAVIILNQEFFGVDLNYVREFINIRKVTPIPCCPSHIIGNMNLRGEILTLVDIRKSLSLPSTEMIPATKAVVIKVEDIIAGIIVQEVSDVIFLNLENISTTPSAIHNINDEYLQGATPYQNKMLSILDLPKILLNGELIVDETV